MRPSDADPVSIAMTSTRHLLIRVGGRTRQRTGLAEAAPVRGGLRIASSALNR